MGTHRTVVCALCFPGLSWVSGTHLQFPSGAHMFTSLSKWGIDVHFFQYTASYKYCNLTITHTNTFLHFHNVKKYIYCIIMVFLQIRSFPRFLNILSDLDHFWVGLCKSTAMIIHTSRQ